VAFTTKHVAVGKVHLTASWDPATPPQIDSIVDDAIDVMPGWLKSALKLVFGGSNDANDPHCVGFGAMSVPEFDAFVTIGEGVPDEWVRKALAMHDYHWNMHANASPSGTSRSAGLAGLLQPLAPLQPLPAMARVCAPSQTTPSTHPPCRASACTFVRISTFSPHLARQHLYWGSPPRSVANSQSAW